MSRTEDVGDETLDDDHDHQGHERLGSATRMDQTATTEWVDGHAMHLKVAERARRLPQYADWTDRRDMGLLLTLTTLAPITVFAMNVGSPRGLVGGLMLATVVVGALVVHWIHCEFAIEPLSLGNPSPSRGRARFRLIPQTHLNYNNNKTKTRMNRLQRSSWGR